MGIVAGARDPFGCPCHAVVDDGRTAYYLSRVILSYRDRLTRQFADGEPVRPFRGFARQAWKRLEILGAATSLTDLATLPSNRLEALKGNRRGQYSIRINRQWRICFEWPSTAIGPSNVEIVDYH